MGLIICCVDAHTTAHRARCCLTSQVITGLIMRSSESDRQQRVAGERDMSRIVRYTDNRWRCAQRHPVFPGGHPSNYWSKKEKKEFAQPRSWTASPHAVTHPGTDVARSCLTSEIGLSPGEITFPEGTRIRRYLFSNIWSKRTPNAIFFSIPPDFSPLLAQFWGQMIQFFKPNPGPYYTTTFGVLGYSNSNCFGPNAIMENQFLEQFLLLGLGFFFKSARF